MVMHFQTTKLEFAASQPNQIIELPLFNINQHQDLSELEELENDLSLLAVQLKISKEDVVKLLYRMDNEQKGKVKRRELDTQKAQIIKTLFQQLGRLTWGSFITVRLPLLKLQENLKAALRTKQITPSHARLLTRVQNTLERQTWIDRTTHESLSAKELLMHLNPNQKPQKHHAEIPDLKARVKNLSKRFQKQIWNNTKTFFKAKKMIDSLEILLNAEDSGSTA